jgi:hypothetical protein
MKEEKSSAVGSGGWVKVESVLKDPSLAGVSVEHVRELVKSSPALFSLDDRSGGSGGAAKGGVSAGGGKVAISSESGEDFPCPEAQLAPSACQVACEGTLCDNAIELCAKHSDKCQVINVNTDRTWATLKSKPGAVASGGAPAADVVPNTDDDKVKTVLAAKVKTVLAGKSVPVDAEGWLDVDVLLKDPALAGVTEAQIQKLAEDNPALFDIAE